MVIWSVANQKGGVGKTTTVVSLGALLAEQGKRVLLLDLDPQGSLTSYFKDDPESPQPGSYHLFQPAETRPHPVSLLVETGLPNLTLIPGRTALATLEKNLTRQAGMGQTISQALKLLANDFDHVLIDTPPLIGLLLINALAAAHRLIIPVQTDPMALSSLQGMSATLNRLRSSIHRPLPDTLVPTLFDPRTRSSRLCLQHLKKDYADRLWPDPIPVDTGFRDAARLGVPLGDRNAESPGWVAYSRLLDSLLQEDREQLSA